jgi:prepilin-type processing-associated H-X9-DG protein
MFRLAPYLELGVVYDQADMRPLPAGWPWWQFQRGVPATPENTLNGVRARVFQCSADTRSDQVCVYDMGMHAALTGYLGVSGRNQFKEAGGQDGIFYVNSGVRFAQITDGTSNTLLVGERPPADDLYFGWWVAGAGEYPYFGAADVVLGVRERAYDPAFDPDFFRPGDLHDPNNLHRYHFWSLHPGGGQFALADGSVRYFRYEIAGHLAGPGVTVFEALASRAGGEVVGEP